MNIGVPKEIKNNEERVALTPTGVQILVKTGHSVLVESNAGRGSGFLDEEYIDAGAVISTSPEEVWAQSDMIMKVKEPVPSEYKYFRDGLVLFTYLHLAAAPELAKTMKEKGVIGIAYETVQNTYGLPLLTPMSEIAGRMSVQIGAQFLERFNGGRGVLLGGVPGVERGRVAIIGGGTVGTNAARIAVGLGAQVTLLDVNVDRLRLLDSQFGDTLNTLVSNSYTIANAVKEADLVVGAVLIPGAKAPTLVSNDIVRSMRPGSVIVDVAIDQGGIFESIDHITTHDDPTYVRHGVVHYAVANMPGAVPRTSTMALTNVTLPYALEIAAKGWRQALSDNESLRKGLNIALGHVTYQAVAEAIGASYVSPETTLIEAGAQLAH